MSYDLTGKKFGYLTVLEKAGSDPKRAEWRWLCRCDCGNLTIVPSYRLRHGGVTSCGCHQFDRNFCSKKAKNNPRLWRIYRGMRTRCSNNNYPYFHRYGGRGIKVCDEWMKFDAFCDWALANGYNEDAPAKEMSLDRINVDKDYSPDNCRWATSVQQANNTSRNHIISANGKSMTIAEWARETGIGQHTISARLKYGWSQAEAVSIPTLGRGEHYYRKTHRVGVKEAAL